MESEPRASATATTKRRRVQRRHKQISPHSISPRLPRTPVRCWHCRGFPANPKTEFIFTIHTQTGSYSSTSYDPRSHSDGVLILIFPLLGIFQPKSQSVFSGPFGFIHLIPTFIHLFFIPFNLPTSHQPHFHPSGLSLPPLFFFFFFLFFLQNVFFFSLFLFSSWITLLLIYNLGMGPQQFIPHPKWCHSK